MFKSCNVQRGQITTPRESGLQLLTPPVWDIPHTGGMLLLRGVPLGVLRYALTSAKQSPIAKVIHQVKELTSHVLSDSVSQTAHVQTPRTLGLAHMY